MKFPKLKHDIKIFPNIIESFREKRNRDKHETDILSFNVPSVNISDENNEYKLNIALPGFDKKDIDIKIQDNCLIISSEKTRKKEDNKNNFIRKEYSYSSFQRIFNLPESADENKIKAKMRNGILTLKIGKRKNYKSDNRIITVK